MKGRLHVNESVWSAPACSRIVTAFDVTVRRRATAEQGSSVRAELRDGLAEARRHAVMLNESTRDDIRMVAAAVAVLTVKFDSLQK